MTLTTFAETCVSLSDKSGTHGAKGRRGRNGGIYSALDTDINVVHMWCMETPRQSITFTIPQLNFLKKEAKRLGISVSDLIRRIIDQYREGK
jgi:hypothetical protein